MKLGFIIGILMLLAFAIAFMSKKDHGVGKRGRKIDVTFYLIKMPGDMDSAVVYRGSESELIGDWLWVFRNTAVDAFMAHPEWYRQDSSYMVRSLDEAIQRYK